MTFRAFVIALPRPVSDLNGLRGALGKALYNTPAYQRIFAPKMRRGPSGFRDLPRPFVLRSTVINVFSNIDDAQLIAFALRVPHASIRMREVELSAREPTKRLRVEFVSPTMLKGTERPDFAALFARARDRVSTLRGYYGGGTLPLNFRHLGEQAAAVRTTRCELAHVDAQRTSGSTGQTHPIGGFKGVAEYEGEITPFLSILLAAELTGVGSKCAWGNGEIRLSTLA